MLAVVSREAGLWIGDRLGWVGLLGLAAQLMNFSLLLGGLN